MLKAFSGGFNFAHLVGLAPSAKAKKGKNPDDEKDGEEGASTENEAEDEECDDEEGSAANSSGKRGRESESENDDDEDEDENGADDGDEDEDEDDDEEGEPEGRGKGGKKGKKGKKAAKPGPAPSASNDARSFKRGRKAERRRIGLILSHPAAAGNIGLATKLACNTGMSSSAAIALLEATPAAKGRGLDTRMADSAVPRVKSGAPEAPAGDAAIQDSWAAAFKKAV